MKSHPLTTLMASLPTTLSLPHIHVSHAGLSALSCFNITTHLLLLLDRYISLKLCLIAFRYLLKLFVCREDLLDYQKYRAFCGCIFIALNQSLSPFYIAICITRERVSILLTIVSSSI